MFSFSSLRPTDRIRAAVRAGAAVAAAAVLLTGCTSDAGDDVAPIGATDPVASAEPGASASGSAEVPGGLPAGVSVADLPAAAEIGNDNEKRADVSITGCAAVEGGWGASGQVANSSEESREYAITVFFTTTDATTVDFAVTDIEVEPGEVGKWEASSEFTAPAETLCVLRGVG